MSTKFSFNNILFSFKVVFVFAIAFLISNSSNAQIVYNFTNAGATGTSGPTQAQVNSTYALGNTLYNSVTATSGIQYWTVPYTGKYKIVAAGAQGGSSGSYSGGRGAIISGEIQLTAGAILRVLVGQLGTISSPVSSRYSSGGGGGSGVYIGATNDVLIVAGGGGGITWANFNGIDAITSTYGVTSSGSGGANGTGGYGGFFSGDCGYGAGGGGWSGSGYSGSSSSSSGQLAGAGAGLSVQSGGIGGSTFGGCGSGGSGGFGFGGGGGSSYGGGGGGGYSGGGGGQYRYGVQVGSSGGGGGSFINSSILNVKTSNGYYEGALTFNGNAVENLNQYNSSNGYVTITQLFSGGTITLNGGALSTETCTSYTPGTFASTGAAVGGSGVYSYQWQSSTDNSTWNDISGETSITYTPGTDITTTTYYRRKVTDNSTPVANVGYSNVLPIIIDDIPTASVAGSNIVLCSGTSTSLAANTAIIGTGTWSRISGPNTPSFSNVNSNTATISGLTTGTYVLEWKISTSTSGTPPSCAVSTSNINLVVGAPSITSSTGGSTCNPGTATLTAVASAGTINWYSTSTGGSSLGTGTSFTTSTLTSTTNFYIDATGGGCTTASRTAVAATVLPNNTITLSSTAGTDAQSKCINTAITNITYNTTGATGATVTGLPTGVTSAWATNVLTISGTPTVAGVFSYTINLTGGCGVITKTGAITVTQASAGTVTGTAASICVGASSTYTATSVMLSGGTGAWSSSNTSVATVNASTGVITGVGAGTATITYTITGGCGGTISSAKSIAINALPTLTAITGSAVVCNVGGSATLSNTTLGGIWSSSNTSVATVDANGLVTGVALGTSTITYTYTDNYACTNTVTKSISVNALPATPTTLVANPATLCNAGTAILTATSTSNLINWYNVATGGSALSTVASGANYTTGTISSTSTFYAEAAFAFSAAQTFNYTGAAQTYIVPATGTYKLEAWGAEGGLGYSSADGGNGAYSSGIVNLTAGQTIYIYVGQYGQMNATAWNGGGRGNINRNDNSSGGGATDFRLVNGVWDLNAGLYSRILVAAGGAGGNHSGTGETAGGAESSTGNFPATQTSAGANGSFGVGATVNSSSSYPNGGGGGGWYGGGGLGGGASSYTPSSGGSSYVLTSTSSKPVGYTPTSNYYFSSASLIAGNASMPNPAGGTNITGRTGDGIAKISFATNPCLSPRVPIVVSMTTAANAGTVTGTAASICVGATSTYTATSVILSGGTGAWSSSNTAVAMVNASTGVITGVGAGTATITYTITGGCGGTNSSAKSITINALPTLTAIAGTTTVCSIGSSATLSNTTVGGIWSSSNTSIATVDVNGVVTGIALGTSTITYTYTDNNACTNAITKSISVSALPNTPSTLVANPATLCNAGTAILTATSIGNNINWYNVATGGTILSTVASGVNYTTPSISSNTTFYAEAAFANGSQTFNYTGAAQTYTVPAGVTQMTFELWGAQGGNSGSSGGKGGYAKGTYTVTPGAVINIFVGGQGTAVSNNVVGGAGWNGGGSANGSGGGGGGASDIRIGGVALNNRIIVAGAGGGGGYYSSLGGYGGGLNGITGGNATDGSAAYGGGGGSQISGGTGSGTYPGTSGSLGQGGNGSIASSSIGYSGGGGGGYYGGAGGAGAIAYGTGYGAQGGGGSSFIGTAGLTNTQTIAGNASMPNPAGGTNITGNTGNGVVKISFANSPCLSPRVPISVNMSTAANAGTLTGTATICVGATSTYTATNAILAGGTGAWSSSNTAVATVNATTGIITGVSAGTATITYTITGGCGGTATAQKLITIKALPTVGVIAGATTVCDLNGTTTLTNATLSGVWSSSNSSIATINSSGIVTGVSYGNATITYTVTNSDGCVKSANTNIVVSALPTTPTNVIATPATLCSGSLTTLNAISTGNVINWYTASTGGTLLSTVASGANYTPTAITSAKTFYAEAAYNSTQTFYYTGAVQNLVIPNNVNSITIEAWGAQGGTGWINGNLGSGIGGNGGYAKGTLTVTPGETLKIYVGGKGGSAKDLSAGGWNGGGASDDNDSDNDDSGGGGGGASDVRRGGTALSNRVIVAGGGGGGGCSAGNGGAGGGTSGIAGTGATGGVAGTQSTGASLGNGENVTTSTTSGGGVTGGGGGGYYGGYGGRSSYSTGGGGGSAYLGTLTSAQTIAGNASMPNPAGGTNITGKTGDGAIVITMATNPCLSPRVPIVVNLSPSASVSNITGNATVCIGSTATYTATNVVLAGGTGAWSSSNTAVATVNATTGVLTTIAAGTTNIVYTISGGCGSATAQKTITVAALPVVAAITGNNLLCNIGATTTLSNATLSGVWSSSDNNIATIAEDGSVNALAIGSTNITYAVTDINSCTNSATTLLVVSALPATPTSVTATPATLCSGSVTTLNAISTGNVINWYTASTGGTLLSTVASGANYTPTAITSAKTFYAEAAYNSTQTFNYTGAQQTYIVPAGVSSITIQAWGAAGGRNTTNASSVAANGGYATGTLSVTPGETLYINVGGKGTNSSSTADACTTCEYIGGFNGGGKGVNGGAGGGGATDLRKAGTALSNRVIVAGGAGGVGYNAGVYTGGYGGGTAGGPGAGSYAAVAGTQSTGYALGVGGAYTANNDCGGGGGGYYGGYGGAGTNSSGAGGSGYIGGLTNAQTIAGNASMPNPNGGANIIGNDADGKLIISAASNPCLSPRVPIVVSLSPAAAVSSVTGNATICVGATSTYTATNVVLAGGSGSWSSSNTAVATVNATTGLVTALTAGTTTITYSIAGGCGAASSQKQITINALPTLTAITGIDAICKNASTTFLNSTSGGVWTSTTPSVATINNVGLITGVSNGSSVISYTYTNVNACTSTVTKTITISDLPVDPSTVTATPNTLLSGATTSLSAVSTGNKILWYDVATGGSPLATLNSGGSFTSTVNYTTTYYAEAKSQSEIIFNHTGAQQTYIVPAGVTSIDVETWGAQGGSAQTGIGGKGGYAKGVLAVTPGETLYIYVGGKGSSSTLSTQLNGGFNGGGYTYGLVSGSYAGSGGGATDIRKSGTALSNRVIVAGGGGGGGFFSSVASSGGAAGGTTGFVGSTNNGYTGGGGGTQSAGGAAGTTSSYSQAGSLGNGGNSIGSSGGWNGSAGGGGYYGGGAGGALGAGGGGGSSYIGGVTAAQTIAGNASMPNPNGGSNITGNAGDGVVKFTIAGNICTSANRIPIIVTVANMSELTTSSISNIGLTTANAGGVINNDGGTPITARGVCWSTSANPTIANSKTVDGSGIGTFASSITGLTNGTTYYVRAYATNAISTSYGGQYTFTTLTVPTITSFTPSTAGKNVPVTIVGTNFNDVQSVQFGGTNAASFTINSNTSITALPSTGATGAVTITSPGGTGSKTSFTYMASPSTQASNIVISALTNTQASISWTNGNGSKRAVFIAANTTGTANPDPGVTYTANTNFASGTQIASSGWYCIYNGTGTSANVTGLLPMTTYRVMVVEYNGLSAAEVYYTNAYTGNPVNTTTLGPTITTNLNSINNFTNCIGTASARQIIVVSGQYLTSNISVTAPSGFEISTTDGSNYAGSLTLTQSSGTITNTNIYVRVTNAASGTISGSVSFTSTNAVNKNVAVAGIVSELSVAGTISGNSSVCIGTNTTDLTLTGNTGNVQWKQSANNSAYTDIVNATNNTVTVNNLTSTTYYKAFVTNGVCSTVATNVFTITANNNPVSATLNLSSAVGAVCVGTNLSASIANAGTGGAGTISDVLQYQYDGGVWNNYTVNTNLTTIGHNDISIKSVRVVTGSGCNTASPNVYSWIVNQHPSILTHPSTSVQSVCQSATATALHVAATGAGLTYQWYKNTNNTTTGGTAISGATSATYTPSTSNPGNFYYYAVVSGSCSPAATSNVSGLYTISGLPTITVQPSNSSQSMCLNATATDLSVTATGGGLTYQWYENVSNSNTNGNIIIGATSSTYKPQSNVVGTKYYYVKIAGTCSPEVTSSVSGAIQTNAIPTVQISQGTTLALGANGTVRLTANASNGTPSYSFQWFKSGVEVSSSPNSGNSYNLNYNVPSIGAYTVKVTDANGCTYTSQQTNIQALPTMSINGADEICAGASVSFIFDATSLNPTGLEWQRSDDNINWYPIQNGLVENGGVAAIQKYTVINTGYFRVAYTDAGNTTYTTASDVTVYENPIVSISPSVSLVNLCANTSLSLSASAIASGTYTYTWTSNGSIVGNADQLSISNNGIYKIKMTDIHGCYGEAVSDPVIFNPLPTATIAGTTVVCEAGISPEVQFTGLSGTGPYAFKYNINGGVDVTTNAGVNSISVPTNDPGVFTYNLVGVSDAIGCYQAMNASASVTVNPLPTIGLGTIDAISMATTNAILPFSNALNSPDYYSITTGARALQNYTAVTASALSGANINVIVPPSNAGTYDFNFSVINTSTGCRSIVYPFELTITAPSVNIVGSLNALSTTYGTPSNTTRFKVSGTYLVSDITVSAPSGFEISTSINTGFASSLTISPVNEIVPNTFVYVRLKATASVASAPYTGTIIVSASNMSNLNVSIPASNITAVPLQITGITISDKQYDGNDLAQINGTPNYIGLQNNESFQVVGTGVAHFADANAESSKTITISGYTAPNANYYIIQPVNLLASINKARLTVTAIDQSVQEGTSDNIVLAQATNNITGFVNNENASVVSGTVTYTTMYTSNAIVGTTSLTLSPDISGLSATNYDFAAEDGFVIVTINPTSYVTVVGNNNFIYNAQAQGPANATVIGSTGLVTYTYNGRLGTVYGPSSTPPMAAGTYQVVANLAADQIYHAATSSAYYFTIAKKQLALRTRDRNVYFGSAVNTALTNVLYDYDGLEGNDNANVISGTLTYTTNYTPVATVGVSGLQLSPNISQLSASNYDLTAYAGTINVVDQAPTITYSNTSFTFTKNSAIQPLVPNTVGANLSFVASTLPAGLSINANSGVITGTPLVTNTIASNYTVTVFNSAGQASVVLSIRIMPDQPQGSLGLKYNTLLSTDSVVLKFNFTQGIAPYNAIVLNTVNNKFDTLRNLTNGQFVKIRPTNTSTVYKLIELSDANNTYRNTAFDNDTAGLQILVPKMALLLSSNMPIMRPDSTYRLQLSLKLKNNGQVVLNNLQVDADLSKLFAAGYNYEIDSIVVASGSMRINPAYTGKGSSNVINTILTKGATQKQYIKSMTTLLGNYLFDNNASLAVGEEALINFNFTLPKTKTTAPAAVQFSYTALANLPLSNNEVSSQVVGALSQDGKPNALVTDAVPLPTVITLIPRSLLASSLHVSAATAVTNGYEFHFTAKLANLGNTNMDSIQVAYSLKNAFKYPDTAFLKAPPTITRGNVIFNTAKYDGYSNDTLIDHSGYLPYGDSIIIDYDVVVVTNKTSATWLNNIQAIALSTLDRHMIIDSSVSGLLVDPNNDGLPDELSYTRATVNFTAPSVPVVTNATYLYQSAIPATIKGLVKSYPLGTMPVWCDLVTAKCDTVVPNTPTTIGQYIYEVRSYDPVSLLYSSSAAYDTIYIKPSKPVVTNTKYIIGLASNPSTIQSQIMGMMGSTIKYYVGATSSMSSPLIKNLIKGANRLYVSQIVNTVESDTVALVVEMLDMNDVIHVQKIASSPKILSNSSFDIQYDFVLSNLIDKRIDSIILRDVLKDQLPSSIEFTIKSVVTSASSLIINAAFNGTSSSNLTNASSYLDPLQKDTIKLTVNINPLTYSGVVSNQASISAKSIYGQLNMNSSAQTKAIESSKAPTLVSIPEVAVVIPAGFSPNNDGIDDKWIIVRPFGSTVSVKVFNRWGAEVYSEANYQNTWDGRGVSNFIGEMVAEGTYFYIVEVKEPTGAIRKLTGSLTIAK